MTAPIANERSEPSPGAPSPDQPVALTTVLPSARVKLSSPAGSTAVVTRRPSVCGTPRNTPGRSKPSRFSRISPKRRISSGSSSSARSGSNSATNSGSSSGRRRDEGRIDREVVGRRVAGGAGPAVAVEGLVHEQTAPVFDQPLVAERGQPFLRRRQLLEPGHDRRLDRRRRGEARGEGGERAKHGSRTDEFSLEQNSIVVVPWHATAQDRPRRSDLPLRPGRSARAGAGVGGLGCGLELGCLAALEAAAVWTPSLRAPGIGVPPQASVRRRCCRICLGRSAPMLPDFVLGRASSLSPWRAGAVPLPKEQPPVNY